MALEFLPKMMIGGRTHVMIVWVWVGGSQKLNPILMEKELNRIRKLERGDSYAIFLQRRATYKTSMHWF